MTRKYILRSILFVICVFLISTLPLFLSFILKAVNPTEYGLIQGNKQDLELTYKEVLFFASIIICFFWLSACIRYLQNRMLKWFLAIIPLCYLTLAFLFILTDVLYYIIFAYRLTFSVTQTILNTDVQEIKDFFHLYISLAAVFTLFLSVVFLLLVFLKRSWFIDLFRSNQFFITSFLLSVFGVVDFVGLNIQQGKPFSNVRYWDITIGEYQEYRGFIEKLQAEKNTIGLSKEYIEFYNQDTLQKTVVLIISESLSKNHMSLYGYQRTTTPNLDTNKSIVKLNDCVTFAALTIDAVPGLFYTDYLSKDINLIALLNKLGYETTWISNQAGWGRKDAPIVLLSQLSKKSIFNDSLAEDSQANRSFHYDEEILGEFEKVLYSGSKASKFIVLHFIGCHFDFEKRFPPERTHFKSKPTLKLAVNTPKALELVNAYDNAVMYHDSVVNCVLKSVSKYSENKNTALIFLSDHGEEIFETRDYVGHCYPPSKIMSEIPYFVYFSPNFKKNYSQLEKVLQSHVNIPYSTGNNAYSILHLLNIASKKYDDKILKGSLFSDRYDTSYIRYVMGADYDKMK